MLYEASLPVRSLKLGIVVAEFNSVITDNLLKGALKSLKSNLRLKTEDINVFKVFGVLEIPLIVSQLAKQGSYDGLIVLGCVIKGDTYHFELVSNQSASAVQSISLTYNIPITQGILCVYDFNDALNRSGGKSGNKGEEATLALLNQIDLIDKISEA